ncbi:hypothetical protein [Miltoncostaea oceani]|uniref:hypothetical protein n=1 Tax=Miltoncostaea oceani TaxID=2843216 RepID=UPI001C3DBB46|nr:hypothetical protein [Miltoncostaea oceani]
MTALATSIRARLAPPGGSREPDAWTRWWPLLAAVVIAFVTWPVGSLTPANGLDPSWRIALHMAVARGVDFGDIAFTYGPLGFLEAPVNAEAHTLVPALAWIGLLQVGLAYLVIVCARRTLTWPVAVLLAFACCRLLDEGREVLPLVAFLWAAYVVQWGVPARLGRVLLPVSGVVCGAGILIKINEGVVALALCAVAAWWLGPGRWRALGILAGSAAAAVVVLWTAFGNGVTGLPGWVVASVRIAAGYSAGLPYEAPGRGWEYALFVALVAAIAWFAWLSGEGLGRGRRIAVGLLGAILVFSLFKHGFVRHDLGHSASTFTALIAGAAAIRWTRPSGRLAGAAVCAATVVASLAVLGATGVPSALRLLDPRPNIETAWDHAALAAKPGVRARHREDAAADLRALHAIPQPVIDALRGHPVHVDPYETSIIWAYDLDWRPAPVFQDYSIYTNALDRGNADMLASADAPDRILRHGGPRIDGHSPEGEGPEQLRSMICGYVQDVAVPGWQVLRRVPWRCGPERPLASVEAVAGATVAIPPAPGPDEMVMARLDIPVSLRQRLRTALYKPHDLPEVLLNEGYAYRVPTDVARGPLLMRAPASVGWQDYAPGFSFDRLRVSYTASPLRIDFVAMRVSPAAG